MGVILAALVGAAMGLVLGTFTPPNRINAMFALVLTPWLFTGCSQYPLAIPGSAAMVPGGPTLPTPLWRVCVFVFAIYLWSKQSHEDSILPNGSFEAAPQEALHCACGLYLDDPSAWVTN